MEHDELPVPRDPHPRLREHRVVVHCLVASPTEQSRDHGPRGGSAHRHRSGRHCAEAAGSEILGRFDCTEAAGVEGGFFELFKGGFEV